jgi:tRNA nucleotidyltransferase (CCA-adding enzyme)
VVASVGGRRGDRVWIVGGLVRDLILGRGSVDIDLVVLGSAVDFAVALAAELGGSVRAHASFLTADFRSKAGFDIDVVRARSEFYESAAKLPVVRSGTLTEDLFRRDFTVNAMALPLIGTNEDLFDPFNGLEDLTRCDLRVLHERSFQDDPTRLLRAMRLGQRLGFSLESRTSQLAQEAIESRIFDRLSGPRLGSELLRLLESPEGVLELLPVMKRLSFERVLHPNLNLEEPIPSYLEAMSECFPGEAEPEHQAVIVLGLLTWNLDAEERGQLADRLSLGRAPRLVLERLVPLVQAVPGRLETLDSVYERFQLGESLGPIGRLLARCTARPVVADFLDSEWPVLRERRPHITGDDLLRLGIPPGPIIGQALEATLRARLDRTISRNEELHFARQWIHARENSGDDSDRRSAGAPPVSGLSDDGS